MNARPFKISIAGAHSTGKTTFLSQLQSRLHDEGLRVGRVRDLAKEARDLGFPILREHNFASTAWIMARGISKELEAAKDAHVVLVDRPVADALGYLFAALKSQQRTIPRNEREYLDKVVQTHTPTYDLHLMTVIDPSIPIDTTKERDLDPEFRNLAQTGIRRAFKVAGLSPRQIKSDQQDQLLEEAVRAAVSWQRSPAAAVKRSRR